MNSYFKFLSRNKLFTFIEVLGLSVALAFVTLIFRYGVQEYTKSDDIAEAEKIYGIGCDDFVLMTYDTAPELAARIPEVSDYVRVYPEGRITKVGEEYLRTQTIGVDTGFFSFFGFPVTDGNPECLNSTDQVIISREFANTLGGVESAIGRTLEFASQGVTVTVGGVFDGFTDKSLFN